MRIIKQGRLPAEKLFKGTCRSCSTIFECKRHEGKYVSSQRDGDFLKVTCPVCGTEAYAYERDDGQQIPRQDRGESYFGPG